MTHQTNEQLNALDIMADLQRLVDDEGDVLSRASLQLITALRAQLAEAQADYEARIRSALTAAPHDPAKVQALVEAAEKMIAARNKYEATPTDRGGAWGTKGKANNDWRIAFAELDAMIAAMKEGE